MTDVMARVEAVETARREVLTASTRLRASSCCSLERVTE